MQDIREHVALNCSFSETRATNPKPAEDVSEDDMQSAKEIYKHRSTSLHSTEKEMAASNSHRRMPRNDSEHRFLLGPEPSHDFGPKARIPRRISNHIHSPICLGSFLDDPSSRVLHWHEEPKTVLVIKKVKDVSITQDFKEIAQWLVQSCQMILYVEPAVLQENEVLRDWAFIDTYKQLKTWDHDKESLEDRIDLIVCLGGDGTLLHASSLFQESCPPIISFHLGSLGFLTPFYFADFRESIQEVLAENVALTLRSRLKCQIRHSDKEEKEKIEYQYLVLNEVVIDRGPSSSLTNLEVYCNGRHITSVLGDGLIVSTPTGSTAYSAAAGASMVHPNVPGIILTPICPHSLSFRPIVLPAGVELRIKMAADSRNNAWASFDGRHRHEILEFECVRITTSVYPVPCISHKDNLEDWFSSLGECLHWNAREKHRTKLKGESFGSDQ